VSERTCKTCGVSIEHRARQARTCSSKCLQVANKRSRKQIFPEPRTCGACGTSIDRLSANARWCSHRCLSWSQRNPGVPHPSTASRSCAQCGVNIDHRDVRSRFCSPLCRDRRTMNYVVGEARTCPQCGEEFLTRRKSSVYCGQACRVTADYLANRSDYMIRAKAYRARTRGARVETFSHEAVFERDGWICYLCHTPVDREVAWPHPLMPSLDHVVPLSRGGEHSRANTKLAHLGCNLSKGTKLIAR
jgi:5-methylcytosine-specific restriction endonuclease McrA